MNPPIDTESRTASLDWVIAACQPGRDGLAAAARVSPLVAQILLCRGISDPAMVTRFLQPQFSELLSPATLPGAVRAGKLLADAVRSRRRIVIYGDYDVDGITATALLWHILRSAGGDVGYYIPRRVEEGYGLNGEALTTLAREGAQVVVSVDCGITAIDEARLARAAGLDLIITDHHHPRAELPDAAAIVHPTALGDSPNPDLCGAGVALKVAWAFAQEFCAAPRVPEPFRTALADACGFAALGLIADVVPLTGENRILAHFGLQRLPALRNEGVQALIEVAGLQTAASYDDYDVGFKLAPRLNAIGRMGHAARAVELFTTATAEQARQIARELDVHNRARQELERKIVEQAAELVVARGFDRASCRAIVLAHEEWHPGVIGIVAARMVEKFCRPTVLISLENGHGQGSGRSVAHFPLHEVLQACGHHLVSHGGHAMAAGVRLKSEHVDAFTQAFLAEAAQRLTDMDLRPKLRLDDEVELSAITPEIVEHLQRLAPHGPGNPRPRLATTPVDLAEPPRVVGREGQHLQFVVRQGNTVRKAVAFRRGASARELAELRRFRLAFEPMINEWNGRRSAELRVLDWQPAT